jgi:DNA-directed RNA polymerase subunit alpha
MEHIHLPTTIEFSDTDRLNVGQVVVTPCQQGYGTTLGNAYRRILLSSLPGAAVESIKIDGVQHEFSEISGVQEDVVEIILNVKQIAVRMHSDGPITLSLSKKGKGEIKAGDFSRNADVDIINPDWKLMTITDSNKTINMEITVGRGSGYMAVSEKNTKDLPLGTIAIDSLYTPIRDIGYKVDLTRVGDVTDYEKLVIPIETDGTLTPKEAISQATQILLDHLALIMDAAGGFIDNKKEETNEEVAEEEKVEEEVSEEVEDEEEEKMIKKAKKKKK